MGQQERIAEVFALAVDVALAQGQQGINKLPGCARLQVGSWVLLVNGHRDAVRETPFEGGPEVEVPPMALIALYEGTPMGVCDPEGGMFVVGTEEALAKALRDELAQVRA